MGGMVTIFDPQGNEGEIPQEKLNDAVKAGAVPAVHMRSPDGTLGYVPANRTHEAVQGGASILPIEQQEVQHPGFWKSIGSDLWGMAKSAASLPSMVSNPAAGLEMAGRMGAEDVARQQEGRSTAYRVAAPFAEATTGANVRGMEEAANEGDVAGVLGHASAVPVAMAAAEVAPRAVGSLANLSKAKVTAPVRAAVRGANTVLKNAPATVGGAAGATVGGYFGGHLGAELGGAAGYGLGKEILPKVSIPGENIGLPKTVEGGPKVAPKYAPPAESQPAPLARPQPTLANLKQAVDESLGVKPLQKGVPLRQQMTASAPAPKPALPEGFTPVEDSSVVKGFKYDPQTQRFETVTNTGAHYVHSEVSPEVAQNFIDAESKGAAWNELKNSPGVTYRGKVLGGKFQPARPAELKTPTGSVAKSKLGMNESTELLKQLEASLADVRSRK